MKQVGGECPLQGIMPTGKGTPGQEARVFLAFHVLLPLDKGKKCIYALRESSKAWQVIWVFPDVLHFLSKLSCRLVHLFPQQSYN